MRVVSLLPSATEIVVAIGGASFLQGRSHECDYPQSIAAVPVLTRSQSLGADSAQIHANVLDSMSTGVAIYDVDTDALALANPDVVITQDLCEVCALPASAIETAIEQVLDKQVTLVRLSPMTIGDVFNDILRIAKVLRLEGGAQHAVSQLQSRLDAVRATAASVKVRPSVLTIEWLDPVMAGGLWTPELVDIAGGRALAATPGRLAQTLGNEDLAALDPDVVIMKPCGYRLEDSRRELSRINELLPSHWRCKAQGRVFVVDGNAYFNRSGPRLIDSTEMLAGLLHPGLFPTHLERYSPVCRLLTSEGQLASL